MKVVNSSAFEIVNTCFLDTESMLLFSLCLLKCRSYLELNVSLSFLHPSSSSSPSLCKEERWWRSWVWSLQRGRRPSRPSGANRAQQIWDPVVTQPQHVKNTSSRVFKVYSGVKYCCLDSLQAGFLISTGVCVITWVCRTERRSNGSVLFLSSSYTLFCFLFYLLVRFFYLLLLYTFSATTASFFLPLSLCGLLLLPRVIYFLYFVLLCSSASCLFFCLCFFSCFSSFLLLRQILLPPSCTLSSSAFFVFCCCWV